jgi:hypothetical protein
LPVFRDDFERALLDLNLSPHPNPERSAVRRAYAQRAKTIRPDDDPKGFQALRQSYEIALIGVEDGFYEEYEEPDEFEMQDEHEAQPELEQNNPIDSTAAPVLGELELAQQNDQGEVQALRDQITGLLEHPIEQEDNLLRLTDQLLAHRGMEWLEVAFETRSWLLSLAAWNPNAPMNWLQQLNSHFELEKSLDNYNQTNNYHDVAIERIVARLNAIDQWANIRLAAASDPKSAASFILNSNEFLPWLWIRTFWHSFDPLFRTSVNNLLEQILSITESATRDQPKVTSAFQKRWQWAQQFAAIGKIKTSLLILFSSSIFTVLIAPEKETRDPNLILSLFLGLCLAGGMLWLGGSGLDKLRARLAKHYAALTRLELLIMVLLLCLLPLVVTAGKTVETDDVGSAFLEISNTGLVSRIIGLTFFGLFILKTAIDAITYQYTLYMQANGEMLFGLALLYAIVAWLTSLSSGFNFAISTAIVGFYLFMATLSTTAIQRAGPDFFTWRGGSALTIKPKQTIYVLIGLLVLHMVATQLLTPSIVPDQSSEFTSPLAYYLLAASALLLCYATFLACGLPISSNQGFIIFTFIAFGASWSFISTVKDTMPLVRFQIADLFLIMNLTYSLYLTHKSQKEPAR